MYFTGGGGTCYNELLNITKPVPNTSNIIRPGPQYFYFTIHLCFNKGELTVDFYWKHNLYFSLKRLNLYPIKPRINSAYLIVV